MYRAPSVVLVRQNVTNAINGLFPLFMKKTDLLPKKWQKQIAFAHDKTLLARVVADYISGMTDRFALQEYKRLTETRTI